MQDKIRHPHNLQYTNIKQDFRIKIKSDIRELFLNAKITENFIKNI